MGSYNQYKTKRLLIHSAKVSTYYTLWHFGDRSLITRRGATKQEGGGAREFLPLQKRGEGEKVLAVLK